MAPNYYPTKVYYCTIALLHCYTTALLHYYTHPLTVCQLVNNGANPLCGHRRMAHHGLPGGMARPSSARSAALAGRGPRAAPARPPEPVLHLTLFALSTRRDGLCALAPRPAAHPRWRRRCCRNGSRRARPRRRDALPVAGVGEWLERQRLRLLAASLKPCNRSRRRDALAVGRAWDSRECQTGRERALT